MIGLLPHRAFECIDNRYIVILPLLVDHCHHCVFVFAEQVAMVFLTATLNYKMFADTKQLFDLLTPLVQSPGVSKLRP
jgi:hypothetical protein